MKALYIAGCLEAGRTGVGDYTRLLAGQGSQAGFDCLTLALHDPFVTESVEKSDEVGCARFPAKLGLEKGVEWLNGKLSDWNPDWVSLQFVPYAFHQRGFVWSALKGLAEILRGRKLEIMFHEVWIGQHEGAPLKQRVTGFLQRQMIRRFVRAARPSVVHTSIPLYRHLLRTIGVDASLLPLFGNVPVTDSSADSWLLPVLQKKTGTGDGMDRGKWWLGGIFGSIHDDFDHETVVQALIRAAAELGRRPACFWIGRPTRGEDVWNEMERRHGREVSFVMLGEQSADRVSEVLNSLDVGLATTPFDIIGKSGAAAAMLEHGLPVLVGRTENRYARWISTDALHATRGVWTVFEYFNQRVHINPPKRLRRDGLKETAAAFYASLKSASK